MKERQKLNIAIASSKEYLKYAQVMLCSLFECNADVDFNIYLLYREDLEEELSVLRSVVENGYGHQMISIYIPDDIYELTKKCKSGSWNLATWYRWSLVDLLPVNIERVLLLGIDIIFQKSISNFYFQDFQDCWFCMCPDMYMKYSYRRDQAVMQAAAQRGIDASKEYYNADVVLINLSELRKHICYEEMMKIAYENDFQYLDQDMINYSFHKHIKACDTFLYNYVPNLKIRMCSYKKKMNNAVLIHYAGVREKPWKEINRKKYNQLWWYYAEKTTYYEQMRQKLYNEDIIIKKKVLFNKYKNM